MYSEADLEAAVAAGALTTDDARRLRDFVANSRAAPAVDEEHFRLLTGFNDIFVAIATIILLVAVAWIGSAIHDVGDGDLSPLPGAAVAATAWGLAEYFTRKRRMALPSIILLLAFVLGIFAVAAGIISLLLPDTALRDNDGLGEIMAALAAAITAGAAWLHWRRFRVPITVAAGAAAVAGVALALIAAIVGDAPRGDSTLLAFALLLGIGAFLFAMWWDASDRIRQTRRSDVAFWLHLLAAPLIVHPIFALLGLTDGSVTPAQSAIVVILYLALGVTALAVDRRALLVSALAYVLYALSSLFREFGAVDLSVALTALVIGSALLLLSAFWQRARAAVVAPLPERLRQAVPPLGSDRVSPQPA